MGTKLFLELAHIALKALTLPISNAVVERIFSFMAANQTKQRNKMQIEMFDALIRVKVHLKVINRCCSTFRPPKDMITRGDTLYL